MTWEEGTWASWLYDLVKPQVSCVLVSTPWGHCLGTASWRLNSTEVRAAVREHKVL